MRKARTYIFVPLIVTLLLSALACSEGEDEPATDENGRTSNSSNVVDHERQTIDGYCEALAPVWCDYYIRCEWMNASSVDECIEKVSDVCPRRYLPLYRGLSDAGLLDFNTSALDECQAHFVGAECGTIVSEIEGPCAKLWKGLSSAGAPCSIGVESLVCEEGTRCVVNTTLCGTCDSVVEVGGTCASDFDCEYSDYCSDGQCIHRLIPGDSCDVNEKCVLGSRCEDNRCSLVTKQKVGESCRSDFDCVYASSCVDGLCNANLAIGSECGARDSCLGGYCELGICVALKSAGAACGEHFECLTGACDSGVCRDVPGQCF